MLTMEDCIDFSGLTEAEIAAIAEHEHVAMTAAAELAQCLSADAAGLRRVAAMIRDDIFAAKAHGSRRHAADLTHTLETLLRDHPEAAAA